VQEQIFNEETGILEIKVPPHSNYTESVYLVSEDGVLLNTNSSCQVSKAPQDLSQEGVVGLPLPWEIPEKSTYYMAKARKTRVTKSKRQAMKSAQKAACDGQAIIETEDFGISEEDFQTMQEGGFVTVKDDIRTRGCQEAYQCSSAGPHACGYTGWENPATGVGFSFHQVSTGSICVTCKLNNDTDPSDFCNPDLCWCKDIIDKNTLMDCAFKLEPVHRLQLEDSSQSAFNQTTTFSGDMFDEKSIKIEVPPHQGSRSAFDQFTVVMHSAPIGYWHEDPSYSEYSTPLKDNMLFKRGDQCLITTIPSDFYPVDGALALKEIVDVVKEEDSLVKHSVLLDEGEMTADEASSLAQPIKEECFPSGRTPSTIRRVTEAKVTEEQAAILDNGGIVLLPQQSSRACTKKTAVIKSASNSWYWPNPETGAQVSIQNVNRPVQNLACCAGGPCCATSYPNLCLCNDITIEADLLRCKGQCNPGTSSYNQCNGVPNFPPQSCTKACTAPDCAESKCCNGCCKRGNVLASLGCA